MALAGALGDSPVTHERSPQTTGGVAHRETRNGHEVMAVTHDILTTVEP